MKRKSFVFTVACLVTFLSIGFYAAAETLFEEVRALLNKQIQITVNGVPWQAKAGDAELYPLTYQDTTYLPLRAIAEALEVPIQWDGATKTVHIGGTSDIRPVLGESHLLLSATITADEHERKINGVDHGEVIMFAKILHSTSRFQLDPLGQYGKLVLKVGIEGDDTRIKLVDMNESSVIQSTLLSESDGVAEIEADITGMQKIMIEVMAEEPNTSSTVKIVADDSYYTTE